jgi:hypothetical protein
MIAVLISALLTTGKVNGDTLSTKGLARDVQKFFAPPAVLLEQTESSMWEGFATPVIFSSSHFRGRRGARLEGRKTLPEPQNRAGGIKRKSEVLRQKK